MRFALKFLPLLVGAMVPFQTAINNRLGRGLGSYFQAALINFAVGTLLLALIVPFITRWPGGDRIAGLPWWAWTGGAFGAAFVVSITMLRSHMSMSELTVLTIAGQLAASLAFDRLGLLGSQKSTVTLTHIAGIGLVLLGAVLVTRGR